MAMPAEKIKIDGRTFLNFSSNDYLGLSRHPEVVSASRRYLEAYGCGATASRLITGTLPPHVELEGALAALKGYGAALVFGSGFLGQRRNHRLPCGAKRSYFRRQAGSCQHNRRYSA